MSCRFGPKASSYGTSGSSGFSGFHDSATSMSNGRGGRARDLDKVMGGNASGSNHSSNRSRHSNGSVGSSGHATESEQQQQPGEHHAQRPPSSGMKQPLTAVQEGFVAPTQQVNRSLSAQEQKYCIAPAQVVPKYPIQSKA